LRAIAVMYVPVDDRHAGKPLGQGVSGCDGNVVEEAKSHAALSRGVVTRRSQEGESREGLARCAMVCARAAFEQRIDQVDRCSGSATSSCDGRRCQVRIGIERRVVTGEGSERFDVSDVVNACELFVGRVVAREVLGLEPFGGATIERASCGLEALGALGVVAPRSMLVEELVVDDEQRRGVVRYAHVFRAGSEMPARGEW
jgi:hypothetical protein